MLTTLQAAVRKGVRIVGINPLIEAGLQGFAHPQEPIGMMGVATPLASEYLQVRIGGDQALYKGLAKALLEMDQHRAGEGIDPAFVRTHTIGYEEYAGHLKSLRLGGPRTRQRDRALRDRTHRRSLCQGPQDRHLLGDGSDPTAARRCDDSGGCRFPPFARCDQPARCGALSGAGPFQRAGDRTMGVFHLMPDAYSDALEERYGFTAPREEGFDVVHAIRAMHEGKVGVFIGLGGNFLQASPDTAFPRQRCSRANLRSRFPPS